MAQALQADVLHERNGLARHPDVERVAGWVDGSRSMLVYALVRQGRAGEALQLAELQSQRARRGDLSAARGTRWLYRLAHALNALQRHEEALVAADAALAQFQQAGVSASSHVGHLALAERLRALMGLRRWAEADAAYQAHLAAVAGDRVATARARNPALAALLAAQAGRLDEALAAVERSLRYRERLFGSDHPSTQEMAGVRGFVRLARGEADAAEADFERLFVAALDRSGGWLDLEQRGQRGFVLGLVFDAYLRELFKKHGNVKLCLSGHMHLNDRCDVDGVSYICDGAVSGAKWKGSKRQTAEGYGLIDPHFPENYFLQQLFAFRRFGPKDFTKEWGKDPEWREDTPASDEVRAPARA